MQSPTPHANPLPKVRLAVFDLDGTLVDSFADIAAAANYALAVMGRPTVSVAKATSYVGHGGRHLMCELLGEGHGGAASVTPEDAARAFDLWREYYVEHPADLARPYPGAVATLVALRRRGVRTAVLSNKLDELVCDIVERLGLASLFDAVRGERPDAPHKPDPGALTSLIESLGARAEETIMVGDGEADILVARHAGVRAVAVDYGVSTPGRLRELGAYAVLSKIDAIMDFV